MPRAPRGRHRGQHRRPKNSHLPAAAGTLALVTAALGAVTAGGAAAETAHLAADRIAVSEPAALRGTKLGAPAALTAQELAAAQAVRAQDTVERSAQRARPAQVAQEEEARLQAEIAADLDATAADRLDRFPADVWVVPVANYRLSSQFGPRWGRQHDGLDLAAPSGTPIVAMGRGEIVEAGWSGGYGQRTILRHEDGTEVWYCHLSAFERTSGPVEAGDVIGYVGSTGNSTGPHLHLEVHPGGGDQAVDPAAWMRGLGLDF